MSIRSVCCAAVCCLAAFFICSCSSYSEGASFTSALDTIDAYISQGSSDDACKALKKLEKRAYTSYEYLGIYKRYFLLGQMRPAEKILKKSLRKLSNNPEITAVYTGFLLGQNRLEDAFRISVDLKDTRYSSFYAECVLRKAMIALKSGNPVLEDAFNPVPKKRKKNADVSAAPSDTEAVFFSPEFISIYESAFKGSGDSSWIFNAAAILMRNGDYRAAAALYPQKITGLRDSLFWGCVFFDSGLYSQSLDALEASGRLASLNEDSSSDLSLRAEILTLESDCLYIAGEEKRSEEIRLRLIDSGQKVSPLVYMNSAMFSKRNGDLSNELDRLNFLAAEFPDYVPGISGLGEYALEQLKKPPEDYLVKKIRSAGLKTLGMEREDNVRSQSIDDIIEMTDGLIEKTGNPQFIVLKDSFEAEKDRINKVRKPVSDIWIMLEKNVSDNNTYPKEIIEYCTQSLLNENFESDAEALFDGYLKSKYDFAPEENPEALELWECEMAAWFLSRKGDFTAGMKLYGFIADKYGERMPSLNSFSGNSSVINSLVNLGVIYASTDRMSLAMDVLNKASSRSVNAKEKSEILFRIAEICWNTGDEHGASRTLKYALSLNPEHNRARLLQKKMLSEQ